MARIFRHYVAGSKLLLVSGDMALVGLATVLATHWRHDFAALAPPEPGYLALSSLLAAIVMGAGLVAVGAYEPTTLADRRQHMLRVLVGLFGGLVILSAMLFLMPGLPLWRSVMALMLVLVLPMMVVWRWLALGLLRSRRISQKVLLLGESGGVDMVRTLLEAGGRRPLGMILARHIPEDPGPAAIQDALASGVHVIVVARGAVLGGETLHSLIQCRLKGVAVLDALSFVERIGGRVLVNDLDSDWLLMSDGFQGGTLPERLVKRGGDVVVSLLFLVLTSPIFALAALAVGLSSKGPVFYRQARIGRGGVPFNLLKFRSMVMDAEKTGERWADEGDPRVTPVGRIIRTLRIDEFPQALNVLAGQMSFVGPRPERPGFVRELSGAIPFYDERHTMKPGITGWAQISYPYGASVEDARRKLEYDLYYVKNYSVFLDVLILLQTIRVILFPGGAR
ncbi:TIGR03013 family XrtA/PEP-CTERM system glycosyltransferase [Yunchengibacter salinarum]|uniref:TIGR03013 family XrtA/PEP-CTERM system glycosyltransferase n=1 Tax=Yunchengibacter salinarum TaxID=3133399 RepID=UPI0035B660BF